jgi:hypothetical protein
VTIFFWQAGSAGGYLGGSGELEGNLSEITIVMQNLPELRRTYKRYEEPAKFI